MNVEMHTILPVHPIDLMDEHSASDYIVVELVPFRYSSKLGPWEACGGMYIQTVDDERYATQSEGASKDT